MLLTSSNSNPKVNKNDDQVSEDSDDDGSDYDDLGEEGDTEETFIHVALRQKRTHDREESPVLFLLGLLDHNDFFVSQDLYINKCDCLYSM